MMELDTKRWHQLRTERSAVSAAHVGIQNQLFDLENARGRFQVERDRFAAQAKKRHDPEVAEAAARSLAETDKRGVALDAEIAALRAHGDRLAQRVAALDAIIHSARAWARSNGARLPDDDDGPSVVKLPATPANARELTPLAQSQRAASARSLPMAGARRAAGRMFNMLGG